jgi:hypothetical protein
MLVTMRDEVQECRAVTNPSCFMIDSTDSGTGSRVPLSYIWGHSSSSSFQPRQLPRSLEIPARSGWKEAEPTQQVVNENLDCLSACLPACPPARVPARLCGGGEVWIACPQQQRARVHESALSVSTAIANDDDDERGGKHKVSGHFLSYNVGLLVCFNPSGWSRRFKKGVCCCLTRGAGALLNEQDSVACSMHVDCTDNLSNKGGGGRSILVTCLQLAAVPLDFARFRVSLSLSLSLSFFSCRIWDNNDWMIDWWRLLIGRIFVFSKWRNWSYKIPPLSLTRAQILGLPDKRLRAQVVLKVSPAQLQNSQTNGAFCKCAFSALIYI